MHAPTADLRIRTARPRLPPAILEASRRIADACLAFDETVPVLENLAAAAVKRRTRQT